jgi:hypothetical protein
MSREKPTDDPRQQTDWKNTKQTDESNFIRDELLCAFPLREP